MPEVCHSIRPHLDQPLVLSIAAGIRARDIARWLGTDQVVRAMPNTPALIGQGASGMAALPQVSAEQRAAAARILGAVGDVVWFDDEALLDPVTALSGSGPAYAFYFIEAMIEAGSEMGLSAEQARRLAVRTFAGAAQLAAQSDEPVRTLRERVTSRGGTTAAALAHMDATGLKQQIIAAIHAANRRARELGDQFGAL
jgi:pyrroline-5-carboxylate reductase